MPSPCGVNCSYVVEFEGPYLDCTNTTTNFVYNVTSEFIKIYNGTWSDPRSASLVQSSYNGTYTISYFNSSTFTPLAANVDAFTDNLNGSILMRQDNLLCIPGRANYTVNNTYENNIQQRTTEVVPISPLVNLAPQTHESEIVVPGFCSNDLNGYGTVAANWSDYALSYYRDNNIMTIVDAMMFELSGSFLGSLALPSSLDVTAPSNDSLWVQDLQWRDYIQTNIDGSGTNAAGKEICLQTL